MHCSTKIAFLVFGVAVLLAADRLSGDERESQIQILQPGVRLSLVAEHPGLATPTGVDVDEQGRIWAVATHTHFRPDDYVGPEHDEILIFADQDGDGRAEQRRVFYNATVATMDLELGEDGWVYLAERDRILRVRDTDGNGEADVTEDLLRLETEADYPHNGLEGLAWDVDGSLVFGLGENYAKDWTLTGTDGASVTGTGEGGIFRCSADGRNLRRLASGFWNPFGICVREDGEIFAAENDPGERPPCRLLHIVEGGDYGYQRSYGPEAHHPFVCWNGELRGTLPMIRPSGEAPCGIAPLGRGLIVPSWSDHRIDFFPLRRHGASYSGDKISLVQGGRYFRPSCLAADPSNDGARQIWYLADWVDGRYESHGYGRLWRLEVELNDATWVGPLDPEPVTANTRLAADLRAGTGSYDRKTLVKLARDEDPFLARAALWKLKEQARSWTPDDVAAWSAADRIQAVLALKLAGVSPEFWVPMFLSDADADVQFETLRWIADARHDEFLPDVERLLSLSDLDYRRFEAAVAAWNTLSGTPEAGVRNLELLLARVLDTESPPRVRAYALRLLPTQPRAAPRDGSDPVRTFPKGLSLKLMNELLTVDDRMLALEVVRTLAGNPLVSQQVLADIADDSQYDATLRAEAVAGLAAVAERHVPLLIRLIEDSQPAVHEEALRSLRSVELAQQDAQTLKGMAERSPELRTSFAALLDADALKTNRPDLTDTQGWLRLIDSVDGPGDVESGRRIFHHARLTRCSSCHRHSGRGNVVGPDLSVLGRGKDRAWLLQSILEPSREMAPQYQPRTVLLNDGRTFTGIRLRSSTREAMRDVNGQNRTFDRDEIDSWVESEVSFMPTGLANSLTIRELRDLIAFLEAAPDRRSDVIGGE